MTDLNNFDCLDLLLQCIVMQIKQSMTMKKLSPLTIKIRDYIQANVEGKITLESVSKAVFFSPVYCSALFKKEMGKGIIEYVIDEKIRKAKNYIIEGVRLKDIAELVGFTDYNYFCRIFKKRVNYTPAQYRKMLPSLPPHRSHCTLSPDALKSQGSLWFYFFARSSFSSVAKRSRMFPLSLLQVRRQIFYDPSITGDLPVFGMKKEAKQNLAPSRNIK